MLPLIPPPPKKNNPTVPIPSHRDTHILLAIALGGLKHVEDEAVLVVRQLR